MVVQGADNVLLCRRVLYIGSTVPMETTEGLEAIQQPLRDRYPSHDDKTIEGIDSRLLILPGGLQLQYVSDPETIIFFPIASLSLCAAVRCVETVNGATGERQAKFVSINKMPPGTEHSKRPAIFTAITRRTQGRKVLECHGFVCSSPQDAKDLVKVTSVVDQAYKNNTPIDINNILKAGSVSSKPSGPSMHLIAGEPIPKDLPAGPEFFENPPSQGYFYSSNNVEVKRFNVEKISDSASESAPNSVINGKPPSLPDNNHVPLSQVPFLPREQVVLTSTLPPQRRVIERPVYVVAPPHTESLPPQESPRIAVHAQPPPPPEPIPIPVHVPRPAPPIEVVQEQPVLQPPPPIQMIPRHIHPPIPFAVGPPPPRPQVRPVFIPVRVPYPVHHPRPRFFSPPPPLVRPMPMFAPPHIRQPVFRQPVLVRRQPQKPRSHSSSRSGSSSPRRVVNGRRSSVGSSSGSDRAKTPPRDYGSPQRDRLSRKDQYERRRLPTKGQHAPAMFIPPHSPYGYKIQIPAGYKPYIPYDQGRARSMPPTARHPLVDHSKKHHHHQHHPKNKNRNKKVTKKNKKNARDDVSTDSNAGYASEIGHQDIMDKYADNSGYYVYPRRPRDWLRKENQFMNERSFSERMHQETRKSKVQSSHVAEESYPSAYQLNDAANDGRDNDVGDFTMY